MVAKLAELWLSRRNCSPVGGIMASWDLYELIGSCY